MRPGGEHLGGDRAHTLPLRVRIARMDPSAQLTPHQAAAWLDAAGPNFRLGRDVTVYGLTVYIATTLCDQPADLIFPEQIGYIVAVAPPRRNFIVIRSVWVDMAVRRRGVGRQLVARLCDLAGDRRRVLVDVGRANTTARDFFRGLGFVAWPHTEAAGDVRFSRML